ncbi:response regulator transcription factor [Cryobacterium psychrophilum]|uniref:Response regulator transcription factor n=1 Tax=Cryobacterium psychrophilum TaxID=41988 RepID=A0A4Y8KM31_9MICO|nr:response regulator transcription factor [Cryobacterium psychrophilum]TDW30193.1 winged helix family two component transcriptional regulator [Cryobacterium psychrophilum]TFD77420.1 response regulator transcription factor [Cryobacterium psychrophilum]
MALVGVCEDDPQIRRLLREALTQGNHTVVMAHNGQEAFGLFAHEATLDVIILDIGLPDSDGRDVCQALRAAGQFAPVLFLTALGALNDVVTGFHAGGDDYVTKPFKMTEILVRVEALSRRRRPSPEEDSALRLDPQRFSVRCGTAEVSVTPTEFRMLAALTARPGEVVRRRDVVASAWPYGAMVQENTIDSYMRRLRHKLTELGSPVGIETVRGVGYVLR